MPHYEETDASDTIWRITLAPDQETKNMEAGIVGLPNVGKSTLFNALTCSGAAQSANYPFCTIEPNEGIVSVPDSRLDVITKYIPPQKVIPAILKLVDIAGIVKGASEGWATSFSATSARSTPFCRSSAVLKMTILLTSAAMSNRCLISKSSKPNCCSPIYRHWTTRCPKPNGPLAVATRKHNSASL